MKEQIKELIKQYLTLIYEASENGADALINQLVRKIMQSLVPSVTDKEMTNAGIEYAHEFKLKDKPIENDIVMSRAVRDFYQGAKWMRDNHLPSKGDEQPNFTEKGVNYFDDDNTSRCKLCHREFN